MAEPSTDDDESTADDDGSTADEASSAVRIRGIYATALTRLLLDRGCEVVRPSPTIRNRVAAAFPRTPADTRIETTRDRIGIEVSGTDAGVDRVADPIASVGIDAFRWTEPVPRGAVHDGEVVDAEGGSGATVDLGEGREGFLVYDDVDGYVGDGDRYRLQVTEPAPPWSTDGPRVEPTVRAGNELCSLQRGQSGVSATPGGSAGRELVGVTELLDPEPPDEWGLRWEGPAAGAELERLERALEDATRGAEALESALEAAPDEPGESAVLAAPWSTDWIRFGRESRFALDEIRRDVTTTVPGHHRTKAASRAASSAVDFAEALWEYLDDGSGTARGRDAPGGQVPGSPTAEAGFPFGPVTRQFGPVEGDRIALEHGKPDGRSISLGRGEVVDYDADGTVTIERAIGGDGTYDGFDARREPGDVARTDLREGRWWYPTTYRAEDGTVKGTYVNVCTPVELFPDAARYVDLYVDVVRTPSGTVSVLDRAELDEAEADGLVQPALADRAREVASSVEAALS